MSVPMMIMAAATTALQIKQQNEQAEAAQQAALNEYGYQVQQQEIKAQQTAVKKGQDISERSKQALRERAKLRTISGESGISGTTTDRMMNESVSSETYDLAVIEENYSNVEKQNYFESKASQAKAQSEIDIAQSRKTTGATAGLQIGLSAVNAGLSSSEDNLLKTIGMG